MHFKYIFTRKKKKKTAKRFVFHTKLPILNFLCNHKLIVEVNLRRLYFEIIKPDV